VNKLVLHHTYAHGLTFDASNNLNHGHATAVAPGTGAMVNSFEFDSQSSRIGVGRSQSLLDLGAIRVRVRFNFAGQPTRRYNLIEGHLSFAIFVNPDESLEATILDATGSWRGARSAPGLIGLGAWHELEFTHDGVSAAQITLDGTVVAMSLDVPGPVRSVGKLGVSIGSWPDAEQYTFDGFIGEVQLYKYDPLEEISGLLDPCCFDPEPLREVRERLRDEGWTGESLGDAAREILQFAAEVGAAARGGDMSETREQRLASGEFMSAFARRDEPAQRAAFGRLMGQARRTLSDAQLEDFGTRGIELIQRAPISAEEAERLAEAVCWKHMLIRDPQDIKPTDGRPRDDDRPRKPLRKPPQGSDREPTEQGDDDA